MSEFWNDAKELNQVVCRMYDKLKENQDYVKLKCCAKN